MNSIHSRLNAFFESNRKLLPGFILIIVLVGLLAFSAVYSFHSAAVEEIEIKAESLEMLQKAKAGPSGAPGVDERLKILEEGLIDADKITVAAAVLQNSFKSLARKHGITITSERPLKATDSGAYTKVPVEFQMKAALPELKELLIELRSMSPMAGVGSISIKQGQNGSMLDVVLVLNGAMRRAG